MAGQLSLLAVSIAIWKPQPIHILELYQIEGNSQCVQALQGLRAGERGQPLRHLQKHLQQISPHTVIHRMKVRVTDQKSVRPKKEELQAILAIEADGRLQPQRLEDALRGWNASTVAPSEKDSPDPLADKQKRWATWKRDIAQHQLMLLATSVDRPEVRKIASSASLASFETSGGSADQAVSTASPEQQWRHLLEEASMQLPAMSPTATNFATPSTSEAFVCRSAGWQPVAGSVRIDRLLAAAATPLFLWAACRCLLELSRWRATRSRKPWTRSLESMGLLSFGRLESFEEPTDQLPAKKWNLGNTTRWWLEAIYYAFPLLLLTKAILNPTWGRFFFAEPIAALPTLLEWW